MIQQFVNALSLGSVYALIAVGYTLVYGILRFINFAHGDMIMIGAFACFYLAPLVGLGHWGALIVFALTMIICAILGVVIERLAYKPVRKRSKITMLITAIGVSMVLEYGGQLIFGADPKRFPGLVPSKLVVNQPWLVLNTNTILVMGVSIALMLALQWVVFRTRIGAAMRALADDQDAAKLMGIPVDRVISITFAIGAALAGAAGVLYAAMYPSIQPLMGVFPGLKAFVAAVMGGIGSIPGAVLGGFLIGFIETFVTAWISPTYRDAIVFGLLIAILIVRPAGILGKYRQEKV